EIAAVSRAGCEGAGDIRAGEEPRDRDVAAEEVVADGEHRHVVTTGYERADHLRAVLTGDDHGGLGAVRDGDGCAGRGAGRAVAVGRRALQRCEEPAAYWDGAGGAAKGGLEGPRHADAVLVLGEVAVV